MAFLVYDANTMDHLHLQHSSRSISSICILVSKTHVYTRTYRFFVLVEQVLGGRRGRGRCCGGCGAPVDQRLVFNIICTLIVYRIHIIYIYHCSQTDILN